MQLHKTLPTSACWLVKYESEMYRLLPRKRFLYIDNRELREGIRYLIRSRYSKGWYERVLNSQQTTEDDIRYYVERGMIWLWPLGEHQEEIRNEVNQGGLSYRQLQIKRMNEINWERHPIEGNRGDGYQLKASTYQAIKDKFKIKK